MPTDEQAANFHLASNGEPYPMGRTKEEQTAIVNDYFSGDLPEHTDPVAFTQGPREFLKPERQLNEFWHRVMEGEDEQA